MLDDKDFYSVHNVYKVIPSDAFVNFCFEIGNPTKQGPQYPQLVFVSGSRGGSVQAHRNRYARWNYRMSLQTLLLFEKQLLTVVSVHQTVGQY